MYAIVNAEKERYDSNIDLSVMSRHMKKLQAVEALKELLLDDVLARMSDDDYSRFSSVLGDDELLRQSVLSDIELNISKLNKKYSFSNGDYILLRYNRVKTFNEYSIPCSSLDEYRGKTVSIISFQ